MERWKKQRTQYSEARQHYDLAYFEDQARDGDLRGLLNRWKFDRLAAPGLDILDFGCGDGALLRTLGGTNGVEVNPHAREAARSQGFRIEEFIQNFEDASMDLVVSNHCLEHVEHPIGCVREMRRVLRPGGSVVIVVPCHRADFAFREADRDFHLFSWSAANLGNLVKLAGFDVVEAKELRHRWPPKWRLINKYLGLSAFHVASRMWARVDRTVSQVVCIGRVPIMDE